MDPELSELLHKLKRAKNGRKKRAPTAAGAVGEMDSTSSVGKSVAEESDFLKAKARVERDRMRTIFPTILQGSWLYKYPSEGSKASAASASETYPRKCRACSTWLSNKASYEEHLRTAHTKGIYDDDDNSFSSTADDTKQTSEHLRQLGIPRKFYFRLDTQKNRVRWYFNHFKDEKEMDLAQNVAGMLALDSVIKISVGVALPGVEKPRPERINDYFTLQAKGRYVVLCANNAPNAHSWVRELRVAVFELGQPPPGDGPSETLFSLLDNKSDNFKDDESVIGMAIERLVTNNPDMLNTPNGAGDTPLLVAIEMNLSHVVQILISLGADASLLGKCKCSVLHAACKNLATRIDSKDEDIDRKPAIRIIESLLDMPIVEKILDTKREGGATCIHDVAASGSVYVLQLLLEKNANPYTCDDYNRTVLHLSCAQQDSDRNTEVVSLLCELVEDALDWQDFEGNTALHLAARIGNFNAVQQLLQTAANPSIKNIAGATPFDIATANNHQDVADIIEEYVIVGDEITEEDVANELKDEAKEHIKAHSIPIAVLGLRTTTNSTRTARWNPVDYTMETRKGLLSTRLPISTNNLRPTTIVDNSI